MKVSFKVNKGNKFGDLGYSPLNRGCPLNTGFTVLTFDILKCSCSKVAICTPLSSYIS